MNVVEKYLDLVLWRWVGPAGTRENPKAHAPTLHPHIQLISVWVSPVSTCHLQIHIPNTQLIYLRGPQNAHFLHLCPR